MAFKLFAAYQWQAKKGDRQRGEAERRRNGDTEKWRRLYMGGDCFNNIKNNSTVGSSWPSGCVACVRCDSLLKSFLLSSGFSSSLIFPSLFFLYPSAEIKTFSPEGLCRNIVFRFSFFAFRFPLCWRRGTQ